jgi:hypothetical protein
LISLYHISRETLNSEDRGSALVGAKYLNRETQLAHDAADGVGGSHGRGTAQSQKSYSLCSLNPKHFSLSES